MQPLQRIGLAGGRGRTPSLFLASDRAAQITGIVLPVDGGTTAGPPMAKLRDVLAKPADAKGR